MTPAAWQAISAIVGTIGMVTSAVAVALISRQRSDVKRSADAAEVARDEATAANQNTVPISDGFARRTTETLAELARRSKAHEARLTWVTDALGQHITMHGAVDILRARGHAPSPSQWWPPGGDFSYGDLGQPPPESDGGEGDPWGISAG